MINLVSILRDAISDYASHADELEPAEWLQGYLGEKLPDKSKETIHSISSELISTLDLMEEKKAAMKAAMESGESAENWFTKEAMKDDVCGAAEKARKAAEFFNGIKSAEKSYDSEKEVEVIDVDGEVWTDDKMTIEKDFDTLPYYIYYQPYCTDFLQERVNVPKNPVKLNQFPESLRRRVPVLPIKFSEKEKIQIAEWVLCNCNSFETAAVDGLEYVLLKLTDGTEAYVLTDENAMDFIQFCSERKKYHCEECKRLECCYTSSTYQRCANPTVMQVINPLNEIDYSECYRRDEILLHSIWQPFMLKIPFKKYAKPNYWVSLEDVRKKFTENQLAEYYKKCYRYLEDRIDFFKPRVLIFDELSEEVISKKYDICNGKVTICGVEYPVFRRSEMESRRAEIESLALLPYRGKKIPHIITVEEMKKLKGE